MKDDLRLDRAFAETPPEIHDAIERAFARGRQDMKKRYKISLALGAAACLVAVLAAALAAGGMGRVHTDVVAAPGLTAVPEESMEVYFTEQGRYYHSRIDCSGMQGARAGTEEEAWSLNKRPCPVCLGGEAAVEGAEEAPEPEEEWVFCTENGRYYHSDVHCSGMRGAREVKLSEATAGGKLPCPVCMAGGSEASMLLVTPEPTELPFGAEADVPAPPMAEPEAEENASEDVAVTPEPTLTPVRMEEAGAEIEAYEEAPGPTLTPVPLEEAGAEGEEAPMVLHREDAQTVYYTQGGKYYHGFDSCYGMHFAEMHTLSDARKAGKERCPKCLPGGEPEHMDLFRSALGLEIG